LNLVKLVALIVVMILLPGLMSCSRGPADKFPSCPVFLLSFDTLRPDHLGCYGYFRNTSPNIDRFSEEAVLFETAIAQAPSTKPSHASMFTSLNVRHHGAHGGRIRSLGRNKLGENALTMAEILKAHGYSTISYNAGGFVKEDWGLAQGFDLYDSSVKGSLGNTVKKGIDWLKSHPTEKFFLFLHTYETHHPHSPDKRFADLFTDGYSGTLPARISIDLIRRINSGETVIDEEDRRYIVGLYDGEIRSLDEAFGTFVRCLKSTGLYDRSLIIITSDHGEEFGEHGRTGWHSHTLYDELLRVPLIMKLPGSLFASTRVEGVVRSIDILPTILDIVDIPPEENFEGSSLVESMEKGQAEMAFAVSQLGSKTYSVRTNRWKLYGTKLYDLDEDPEEMEDVSMHRKELLGSLKVTLDEIMRSQPPSPEHKQSLTVRCSNS
jgi:arylsulfatase A-like enzyme